MKVNNNVPQWVLDIFNRVAFAKIPSVQRKVAISFLTNWANSNLLLMNPDKKYPVKQKKINKRFDKDLLDLLNKYDYDAVTDEQKLLLKSNLKVWEKKFNIPVEEKYVSIFA